MVFDKLVKSREKSAAGCRDKAKELRSLAVALEAKPVAARSAERLAKAYEARAKALEAEIVGLKELAAAGDPRQGRIKGA